MTESKWLNSLGPWPSSYDARTTAQYPTCNISVTLSYLRPPTGTTDTKASFFLDISTTEGERTT